MLQASLRSPSPESEKKPSWLMCAQAQAPAYWTRLSWYRAQYLLEQSFESTAMFTSLNIYTRASSFRDKEALALCRLQCSSAWMMRTNTSRTSQLEADLLPGMRWLGSSRGQALHLQLPHWAWCCSASHVTTMFAAHCLTSCPSHPPMRTTRTSAHTRHFSPRGAISSRGSSLSRTRVSPHEGALQ